jgi:4-amino-4-deoxy-L-arabinose transferase-like glycosyltransferase
MLSKKSSWMTPQRIGLLFVLLVALALRIATLNHYGIDYLNLHNDDEGYTHGAQTLLKSGMLTYHNEDEPTVHIMPGQPALIAAVFAIFGDGTLGVYAIKALILLLGVSTVYAVYWLGTRFFGTVGGFISALLLAVAVPQVVIDLLQLTETPFMFCLLWMIVFTVRAADRPNWGHFIGVVFFYLAALMFRATVALYPLVAVGYLLLRHYPRQLLWKQLAAAAVIVVLMLSPWWIRNYAHYQAFIPLTGGQGNPLLLGTYQGQGYPNEETLREVINRLETEYTSYDAYTMMAFQEREAKKRIREWRDRDPQSFLYSYLWLKPKILWKAVYYPLEIYKIPAKTLDLIQRVEVKTAVAGFFLLLAFGKGWRREVLLLGVTLVYFTLLYAAYFAFDRYNLPEMPLLYLLLGGTLAFFLRLVKKSPRNV